MTPADSINRCLQVIKEKWYDDKAERIFYRDKRNLTKAICRYGYVCSQRGWEFQAHEVTGAILNVLIRIDAKEAEYLPVFLEACIDRHVRQRSEEISEQAKALAYKKSMAKAMGVMEKSIVPDSVRIIEKSDTEIMATMYRELNKKGPKKVPSKQLALF